MRVISVTKQTNRLSKGFTLLELLVVIALIGIIASIVIVNLQESREQSQNAAVIAQVNEYEKALQLYFAENASFPGSYVYGGVNSGILCLGDSAPLNCLDGNVGGVSVQSGGAGSEQTSLNNSVRTYMPSLPHINQAKGGRDFSSPAYSGCSDFTNPSHPNNSGSRNCTSTNFSLWFVLKGTNQDCGRATLAAPVYPSSGGVHTLCRLQQ